MKARKAFFYPNNGSQLILQTNSYISIQSKNHEKDKKRLQHIATRNLVPGAFFQKNFKQRDMEVEDMEFLQGNSQHVEIPGGGSIKKELKSPGLIKRKICGISMGLIFNKVKEVRISRVEAQFCPELISIKKFQGFFSKKNVHNPYV